jgi:hypothetical protein
MLHMGKIQHIYRMDGAKEAQYGLIMHYLYDYLFVGTEKSGDYRTVVEAFHKFYLYLNIPIGHKKL